MTPNNKYYVIKEPRFLRETEIALALANSPIFSSIFSQKFLSFKQLKHWYLNLQYIRIDKQTYFVEKIVDLRNHLRGLSQNYREYVLSLRS